MRVFYGIEFDKKTKNYIDSLKENVRERCIEGRFTLLDNLHLTLKFIGEINENQLKDLRICLDKTAAAHQPFDIELNKLGYFPRQNKIIPWIGINMCHNLIALQKDLDNILTNYGYEKDTRAYKPHITLGRQVKLLNNDIFNEDIESWKYNVASISLMESKRINGRLVYDALFRSPLI